MMQVRLIRLKPAVHRLQLLPAPLQRRQFSSHLYAEAELQTESPAPCRTGAPHSPVTEPMREARCRSRIEPRRARLDTPPLLLQEALGAVQTRLRPRP